MKKKVVIGLVLGVWLIVIGVVLTLYIGFWPQWFDKKGVYIELTYAFKECEVPFSDEGFCLETKNYRFAGRPDAIDEIKEAGYDTIQDYIDVSLRMASMEGITRLYEDENTRFYYILDLPDEDHPLWEAKLMIVMEGESNYYRMIFFCESKDYHRYEARFLRWAKTIRVD